MGTIASVRVLALATLLAWLAVERSSEAAVDRRVVLLRPTAIEVVTTMAMARIKGELVAAGFEVTLLEQQQEMSPRTAVETAAQDLRPLAVFAIFRDPAGPGAGSLAEIWISDRIVGRTLVERMRLDGSEPERGATVLAVRAAELLKASLAEFWVGLERSPTEPLPTKQMPIGKEMEPPPERRRSPSEGLGAQAALGVLHSFGEIGPVVTPLFRLSYGTRDGLGARLTLGGLGANATVAALAGTARVEQLFGMLEGFMMSRLQGRVQLFGSAGIGAYRLRLEGTGVLPYRGKSAEGWSLLSGLGAGLAVEVYPHVAVVAETHAFWAWPSNVIRFDDTDVGKKNWPILLASLGIEVRF